MHVNVCTLVGRVSLAGPKLSYASSGTPVCSLVVEIDEMGPGEKVYTTWLPVRITGKHAEQSSVDLEPGDIVMVSGKLKYEAVVDKQTQQKTSKFLVDYQHLGRVTATTRPRQRRPRAHVAECRAIPRLGMARSTTRLLARLRRKSPGNRDIRAIPWP